MTPEEELLQLRACQQITVACFPQEVRAPMQYGPAVGAIGVYLVQQQLLPLARACEVMEDLLVVLMSERTLCELISRCAQSLTDGPFRDVIRDRPAYRHMAQTSSQR